MNGPALGFGQSLAFACDLIVAQDDAGIGYQMVGFLQREINGGEDPTTL